MHYGNLLQHNNFTHTTCHSYLYVQVKSSTYVLQMKTEKKRMEGGRTWAKKKMKRWRGVYKWSYGLGMTPIGHLKEEKSWISPKKYTDCEGECVASRDRRNASCCQASPRHLCCVSGAVCGRTWLLDRQTCQHNFVPSKKTKQLFPLRVEQVILITVPGWCIRH